MPQAYDATLDAGSSDPARRATLRALSEALTALPAEDPYAGTAVALAAEPPPAEESGVRWPGPSLSDLPAGPMFRCTVLDGADAATVLEAVEDDAFGATYTDPSDGSAWRVLARLALPHEQDCEAVRETVRTASGS